MGTIIAVNGKGGTGKTTFAALCVAQLAAARQGSVLAIDADPNSCLPAALGIDHPPSIVGTCEEIARHMDRIPGGMTKERYITLRVQETIVETDRFDLLVMGRPEGPGCYCYVNTLLRDCMETITAHYDYVVIDNAAGMEHISRRTTRRMHTLVLVSDYSVQGIRSAKRIYALAKELGITMSGAYLVVNRTTGPLAPLEAEIAATGLTLAGEVPFRQTLVEWGIAGKPVIGYADEQVSAGIDRCVGHMLGAAGERAGSTKGR